MQQRPFIQRERSADNRFGLFLAVALAVVGAGWAGLEFVRDWQAILPPPPAELRVSAYLPENGGWVAKEMRVEAGQPVRLVLNGRQGTHAFALAHTEIRSPQVGPGQSATVAFTAPEPGRYVLYCTVWCSPNHWRMRTVLEVVDPKDPEAPLSYVQDPQRYTLPLAQMDLDAPHPAGVWPADRPQAEQGAKFWREYAAPGQTPGDWLAGRGWPLVTPAEAFADMGAGQLIAGAGSLSEPDQWALVAFLWRSQTTPATIERGAALYRDNCQACHGVAGRGDGFASAFSPGKEPDFQDASSGAGASPGLYYAKIARGGMGTGMPNWGAILGEDDLWAVVDYLYTFLFVYGDQWE